MKEAISPRVLVVAALLVVPALHAQTMVDTAEVVKRVRAGGWFEQSRWRRADDGTLQMNYWADIGERPDGSHVDRYVPLLGEGFLEGLLFSGPPGLLAAVCHGPGDLLGMTDAEFHLGALGVDTSDEGLRQYLATPQPSFEGPLGRARMLDRMLAIDLLCRRGCKAATAELHQLVRQKAPAPLRQRARQAVDRLEGREPGIARRRLPADTLRLPSEFDACVVVDHTRLPELAWLPPFARRLGALITVGTIEKVSQDEITTDMCNGAQRALDVVSELPFGLAHRYGNARLDHSCLFVRLDLDDPAPELTWQAAGSFEPTGWQGAVLPERVQQRRGITTGSLAVTEDHLEATIGMGADELGEPRPEEAVTLLKDVGSAIRVTVPEASQLLRLLNRGSRPIVRSGEVTIQFGDPFVLTARLSVASEAGAAEWARQVTKTLPRAVGELEKIFPEGVRAQPEVQNLLAALRDAKIETKGSALTAAVTLSGFGEDEIRALLMAQLLLLK